MSGKKILVKVAFGTDNQVLSHSYLGLAMYLQLQLTQIQEEGTVTEHSDTLWEEKWRFAGGS